MYAYYTQITEQIVRLLAGAQQTVWVCVPALANASVFSALVGCAKKGIQVQLLVQTSNTALLPLHELTQHGGSIQMLADEVFAHPAAYQNYCVIDETWLIYGSYTWSAVPNEQNAESILLVSSEESDALVQAFCTQFKALWQMGQEQAPNILPYAYLFKIKIQCLEWECAFLEAEIQEIRNYYAHVTEYVQLHLGELILQKLQLEAEIEKKKAEQLRKKIYEEHFAQKKQDYEAFKEKFKQFQQNVKEIQEKVQQKAPPELKELYKKLIKYIHPDIFADNPVMYQKATEMMKLLNQAYAEQNLQAMLAIESQILNSTWLPSMQEQESDTEAWEQKLIFWEERKKELWHTLQSLKQDVFYRIFTGQITLEEYCHQLKLQLQADIRILNQNLGSL